MKNIFNRTTILCGIFGALISTFFLINKMPNAVSFSSSSNVIDIVGTWVQNDNLYNKEVKEIDEPMGNLSDAFGEIKLSFNEDFTYTSYFDAQIHNGEWKIENNLFYMKRNDTNWEGYKYKINKNELFIYVEPWLMALLKK